MTVNAKKRRESRQRRHFRIRKTLQGTQRRPRLAVHRSNRHITAQLIDDSVGHTLASAASTEQSMRPKNNSTTATAEQVGKVLAQRAQAAGVKTAVFDRGGFRYHGQIAALADAARKAGLEF